MPNKQPYRLLAHGACDFFEVRILDTKIVQGVISVTVVFLLIFSFLSFRRGMSEELSAQGSINTRWDYSSSSIPTFILHSMKESERKGIEEETRNEILEKEYQAKFVRKINQHLCSGFWRQLS